MIITKININAFGKFIGKEICFTNGVNVIYGNNEAGKTTTHAFIKAMLFGIKKKKSKGATDIYSKYMPWDAKNVYGGTLNFIYNDNEYEIYREFTESNSLLQIRNLNNKRNLIDNPEAFLNKVLHNLNVSSFDNTISISQLKSAQDSSMIYELHRIIANLNTSGDMSIDTLYALNSLNQKKSILSKSVNADASIIYNRQLGNIRNIEKELSNKKYENILPEILSKKTVEAKKIESNNKEIEDLKKDIINKTRLLDKYGFVEDKDIDSLSQEASKIYLEYKPMLNKNKLTSEIITNIIMIVLGIVLMITSFLFLVATYPDVATVFNINETKYSMNVITNFIIHLPFHPIILIAILLCLGLIFIFGNIIVLINNLKSKNNKSELKTLLSDIFYEHINDSEVNNYNMISFKKHIKEMRKCAKDIDENESRIVLLTKENNDLLKKQTEYGEIIKSYQKTQFDVEQKYNELYKLRDENEKMKNVLLNNDILNEDIESINLAIETIKSLSDEIHIAFGTHLNKTASNYIEVLTNGKYKSLSVDNSLSVTINYDGKLIPLSKVSTGTIDQFYLALRLAITDIINGNGDKLPLLFDDCFAMYDNERLTATLKFLSSFNNTQLIIFTCHERENMILLNLNSKYNYITI